MQTIFETMKTNDLFLVTNLEIKYKTIIDLQNDAVDLVLYANDRNKEDDFCTKNAMGFFINHILMPHSNSIFINTMTGNHASSNYSLRLMLESLVKSYFADINYPWVISIEKKLELLDKEVNIIENKKTKKQKKVRITITQRIRDVSIFIGAKNEYVELWQKLSNEWLHSKGYVRKIISYVEDKSDFPTHAVVIPMPYNNNDIDDIKELSDKIRLFKTLIFSTMSCYDPDFDERIKTVRKEPK